MLQASYPYWLGGKPVAGNGELEVTNKYTGEVVSRVPLAKSEEVAKAIRLATQAAEPMRKMSA